MTKNSIRMTLDQARDFVLRRQMLDGRRDGGEAGALRALRRLGYVQIDSINVVERAHHHALWSRVTDYRPGILERLQRRRKVFEYWAHAMCYLPMEDYRFYRRHMEEFPAKSKWYQANHRKYGKLAGEVLARVRCEGPLTTGDFKGPKVKRGGWWDWKPAKTALEMLFYRGDLMVAGRRGFQRVYDLTERVLPEAINTSIPAEGEAKRFFVRRALSALGLATEADIDKYITIGGKLGGKLLEMAGGGEVAEIAVQGLAKPYFMLGDLAKELMAKEGRDDKARLLSPFDNAVILRQRARELFGMDFAMECYLPQAKRKYGYFSLPILWRSRLVGRLDPKAVREAGTLVVRSLHLEKTIKEASFYRELGAELERYAEFNGCGRVAMAKKTTGPERKLASRL